MAATTKSFNSPWKVNTRKRANARGRLKFPTLSYPGKNNPRGYGLCGALGFFRHRALD